MALKDRPTDAELLELENNSAVLIFDDKTGNLVAVRMESNDGVGAVYTRRFETKLVDEMPEARHCKRPVVSKRCSTTFLIRKAGDRR